MGFKGKAKSGGFHYQERTPEQMKQRADQRGGAFDSLFAANVTVFSVKEGDYTLRILPPTWDNPLHYGFDIFVHYSIGASDSSYLCLNKNLGEPCPMCEEQLLAKKQGKDDYVKELNPTKRIAVWAINRDAEDDGPQLWSMPWTMDRDLVKMSFDNRTGEILKIDHHEHGFDVEFSREGKGMRTKYLGLKISRRESPLHEDPTVQQAWLDYVVENPVPDVLEFKTYDYLKGVFSGTAASETQPPVVVDEEETDTVEEETPRTTRAGRDQLRSRLQGMRGAAGGH